MDSKTSALWSDEIREFSSTVSRNETERAGSYSPAGKDGTFEHRIGLTV